MKIRNAEDLAHYIGASDASEDALSHRLYKDTDCGASVALVQLTRSGKPREERWQVQARLGLAGIHFTARRNSRGPWLAGVKVPANVRDYFGANERGLASVDPMTGFYPGGWAEFISLATAGDGCKVQKKRLGQYGLSLLVTLDGRASSSTRPGVQLNSIVEGVDQYATPVELAFPFSGRAWDAAVQTIEDEVTEIWNDTHGCEGCAKLYGVDWRVPETGNGYCPVHPDCKECGGTGTIL